MLHDMAADDEADSDKSMLLRSPREHHQAKGLRVNLQSVLGLALVPLYA